MRDGTISGRIRTALSHLGYRIRQILKEFWSSENLQSVGLWCAAFLGGLLAVEYAQAFRFLERIFNGYIVGNTALMFCTTPVLLFFAGFVVQKYAPGAAGSGIPQILAAHSVSDARLGVISQKLLSLRVAFVKIVSSLLAVLGGGVIGREGPTLQISACAFYFVGTKIRRYFPSVNPQTWIVAGAAAGLAAAFNTPLGGIVYAIEEFSNAHFHRVKMQLITSVIVAGLVAQWLQGPYLYLGLPRLNPISLKVVPLAIMIGCMGGLTGGAFGRLLTNAVNFRRRLTGKSAFAFSLVSGMGMASIIYLVPRAAGSGYHSMADILLRDRSGEIGELMARFAGTILTYMTGAAGGIFAPSLSMGAIMGSLSASFLQTESSNLCALLGMISVLTGVTRTPFTAFILVLEMTDRHSAIFPMMISALVAQGIAGRIDPHSFYENVKSQFTAG